MGSHFMSLVILVMEKEIQNLNRTVKENRPSQALGLSSTSLHPTPQKAKFNTARVSLTCYRFLRWAVHRYQWPCMSEVLSTFPASLVKGQTCPRPLQ